MGVPLFYPPPAESLNFHMKVSNARSQDSKYEKIAVKVNHPQKVKSAENKKILNFGKNDFYRSNHNLTYFKITYKSKSSSKMSKSRKLLGNSPIPCYKISIVVNFHGITCIVSIMLSTRKILIKISGKKKKK